MKTNHLSAILTVISVSLILMSFMILQDQKKGGPRTIPSEYETKKMPAGSDASQGKMLWAIHCKSCHGNQGLGDGPKSANLSTSPGNFKSPEFQAQPDGAIYYESFFGRNEMPGFQKKIPDDEDRWNIVAFIRTLK